MWPLHASVRSVSESSLTGRSARRTRRHLQGRMTQELSPGSRSSALASPSTGRFSRRRLHQSLLLSPPPRQPVPRSATVAATSCRTARSCTRRRRKPTNGCVGTPLRCTSHRRQRQASENRVALSCRASSSSAATCVSFLRPIPFQARTRPLSASASFTGHRTRPLDTRKNASIGCAQTKKPY